MASNDIVHPVTVQDAGRILDKAPATIHVWAFRYGARKVGKRGRRVLYDLDDLKVIEREIFHEHEVPATWQDRAAIRAACPQAAAERSNRAA